MVEELGSTNAGTAADDPAIIAPTAQAEVDRLWDAGGPVRGVVARSKNAMAAGDRSSRVGATVWVRARLRGGGLGPEQKLRITAPWKVVILLDRGLEVPVAVDRATGQVTEVLVAPLADELADRAGEAKQRQNAFGVDLGGITQLPGAIRDVVSPTPASAPPGPLAPGDPAYPPINGVTWAQLIQVVAHTTVHPKGGYAEGARQVGLTPEAFGAAHIPWMNRTRTEPGMMQRFAAEVDLACRALRGR